MTFFLSVFLSFKSISGPLIECQPCAQILTGVMVLCVLQPQGSAGWYRPSSMNPQTDGGGLGSTPGGGTQGEGQF